MSPKFSIIVTCKGRLGHLLESLPHFLRQKNTQVVVVDYSCPDRTSEVIRRKFENVTVVDVTDDRDFFNICRARNIGAKSAKGEYLAFFDADVIVEDDLMETVDPHIEDNAFHVFRWTGDLEKVGIYGSCIVHKKNFEMIGGYDEVMRGYGGEDKDLYYRFELANIKCIVLDDRSVRKVIQHRDEDRTKYRKINADKIESMLYSSTYRQLKNMVLRIFGLVELDRETRDQIYERVLTIFENAKKDGRTRPIEFEVGLPADESVLDFPEWGYSRKIAVQVFPKQPGRR